MHLWTYIKSRNKTLIVAVIAVVVVTPLIIWSFKPKTHEQKLIPTDSFWCPEVYGTQQGYYNSIMQFIRQNLSENPNISIDTLNEKRVNQLISNHCRQTPIDLLVDLENMENLWTDIKPKYLIYNPLLLNESDSAVVTWVGKIHWVMTYGRLLFQNLTPNVDYEYFIAEPDDVISDGALRYSSTTRDIGDDDVVKVVGIVKDSCFWTDGVSDTDYKGCVPWVEIIKITQL